MPNALTLQAYNDWKAACGLLADSLKRYQPYDHHKKYTSQELEFYDSLSFRYTKAMETAFYFFRTWEIELNGKSSEFLRDQLLKMEKSGLLNSTDEWMQARQLRNKITHSYDPQELEKIFANLIVYAQEIINAASRAEALLIGRPQ